MGTRASMRGAIAAAALVVVGCSAPDVAPDAARHDAFVTRDAWRAGPDAWLSPPFDASVIDAGLDAWRPADVPDAARTHDAGTDAPYARQDTRVTNDCGVLEACNDLDDDCDGRTDEDLADCVVVACGTTSCTGTPCCTDVTYDARFCGECSPLSWSLEEPCDGPEDCAAGTSCCLVSEGDLVTVGCTARCQGSWRCHTAADCPDWLPRCLYSVCEAR